MAERHSEFFEVLVGEVMQDSEIDIILGKALDGLCYALLVGRNDLAESSGSMRAESAVEPTRSENITVT